MCTLTSRPGLGFGLGLWLGVWTGAGAARSDARDPNPYALRLRRGRSRLLTRASVATPLTPAEPEAGGLAASHASIAVARRPCSAMLPPSAACAAIASSTHRGAPAATRAILRSLLPLHRFVTARQPSSATPALAPACASIAAVMRDAAPAATSAALRSSEPGNSPPLRGAQRVVRRELLAPQHRVRERARRVAPVEPLLDAHALVGVPIDGYHGVPHHLVIKVGV
mmetsp:Transcript_31111/g.98744  ORF Transcript_31111/g.98744 Transcript_31111/m.98744 type:complete len:226 (+) Transcript_31111:28-705(+)